MNRKYRLKVHRLCEFLRICLTLCFNFLKKKKSKNERTIPPTLKIIEKGNAPLNWINDHINEG